MLVCLWEIMVESNERGPVLEGGSFPSLRGVNLFCFLRQD